MSETNSSESDLNLLLCDYWRCEMLEQLSNDYFEKSEKVRAMGLRNVAGLTFDERKQAQFQYDFAIHERDKAKRALDNYRSKDT